MAKVIIVIDVDENDIVDISKVRANITLADETNNYEVFEIHDNVPIMYIPNEKVSEGDEYWSMYAGGWNDRLIEIKSVNEDRK